MRKFTLTLLVFFTFFQMYAQERFVVRISAPETGTLMSVLKSGHDIAAFVPDKYIDLVVDQQAYTDLQAEGFTMEVTQTERQLKENMVTGRSLAGYRTYSDLYSELLSLQASHPDICKLYDIGDSRGKGYSAPAYNNYKHDIWAVKVSDNVETEEDEPCIFYMGEHHAREPISLEVVMYVLNHILSNYGTDPSITSSVNSKQIWFVPLVNPDGHKIVTDETDLWWRKNIADNNNSNTINSGTTDGVDPNRNYDYEWGGSGTSTNPSDITYCGPYGFSEPETMAMKNLIDGHHFISGITYHSYSELVLFPYGYAVEAFAPDHAALEDLAISMAETIPAADGGNYFPDKSSGLYPASGTTDDYAYGEHGVFCYTIELGTVFIPPASQIEGICEDNLEAALILLNRSDALTLTGLVRDAATQLPLQAEVYIEGIDNTGAYRAPFTSNETFGRYLRMLTAGNYTVTFSKYGYLSQTFTGVNLNTTGQTVLDVNLVQAQTVSISGLVTDAATGLPVEGALISLTGTPINPVSTNNLGEYLFEDVTEGTFNFRVSKPGYATVVQQHVVTTENHVFNFQLQESAAWSFESGSFEPEWTFTGAKPWTISTESPYEGLYCSKSGAIAHSQNSEMSITLNFSSDGDVSFFRKVSSESGYDYLRFSIDGVQQGQWSGTVAWGEVSYPVTAGTHTFTWNYVKDQSVVGGSDCAWVDFIQFPPMQPIPDPADISVSATAFSVLLAPGSNGNETLVISNTGESELTFTAQVVYESLQGRTMSTVVPLAAAYNTGTTTSAAKTQTSLVKGYPTTEAGWMKFDLSQLPDGAAINSVEFHGYVNATNYPYWNINPVTNDPVSTPAPTLYADIVAESASGYYLYRSEASSYATGWKVHTLGGNAAADLQAALAQNWFAIGIMDRDNSSSYYIGFDGWNESNPPYLQVDYTYTPPYSWLSLDGSGSISGNIAGSGSQEVDLTFTAGALSPGTYNASISIQSNDPDEAELLIPCTLTIAENKTLNLSLAIEGLYAGNGSMNKARGLSGDQFSGDIADMITVELHDADDYTSVVSSFPETALSNSGQASVSIPAVISGSYYLTIKHRNSLETISASPVSFSGSTISYSFNNAAQAYNGMLKEMEDGGFAIYSGDVNHDLFIDTADMTPVDNDANAYLEGYIISDVNGDGITDTADMTFIDNSAQDYIFLVTP